MNDEMHNDEIRADQFPNGDSRAEPPLEFPMPPQLKQVIEENK